jgi:hypothetical protein
VGAGIAMPGVCLCPAGIGVPVDLLTFGRCAVARRRIFRLGLRLAAVLGFGLLVPGITCPSCCAITLWLKKTGIKNHRLKATNKNMRLRD